MNLFVKFDDICVDLSAKVSRLVDDRAARPLNRICGIRKLK